MYANPRYLVETDWLADHLGDPDLRLFDVTGMLTSEFVNLAKARSYDAGHIPGAAFLDVAGRDQALAVSGAPIPWTWPEPALAAETLGAIGSAATRGSCSTRPPPGPGSTRG